MFKNHPTTYPVLLKRKQFFLIIITLNSHFFIDPLYSNTTKLYIILCVRGIPTHTLYPLPTN